MSSRRAHITLHSEECLSLRLCYILTSMPPSKVISVYLTLTMMTSKFAKIIDKMSSYQVTSALLATICFKKSTCADKILLNCYFPMTQIKIFEQYGKKVKKLWQWVPITYPNSFCRAWENSKDPFIHQRAPATSYIHGVKW